MEREKKEGLFVAHFTLSNGINGTIVYLPIYI